MALSAQRIAAIKSAIDELASNGILTWAAMGFEASDLDAGGMPPDWTPSAR